MYISAGKETEQEVERAFQQSVQGASDPAPTNTSVQLTAAVHDMDIDHLLQKLICGEIEYNPHDPNRYAACREAFVCLDDMQHDHRWHALLLITGTFVLQLCLLMMYHASCWQRGLKSSLV